MKKKVSYKPESHCDGDSFNFVKSWVDKLIVDHPELTYDDFEFDQDYSSCYYEGDTPSLMLKCKKEIEL